MCVKPDRWIRKMALGHGMIEPFSERVAGPEIISYGLQSAGYDVRLGSELLAFDWARAQAKVLDPLEPLDPTLYFSKSTLPWFDIPPNGSVQGLSLEYFRIPRDIKPVGESKTTYSSKGVSVSISTINPGWEGKLLLLIENTGPIPRRIRGGQGIVHLVFHQIDSECERSYAELAGTRFQGRTTLLLPQETKG